VEVHAAVREQATSVKAMSGRCFKVGATNASMFKGGTMMSSDDSVKLMTTTVEAKSADMPMAMMTTAMISVSFRF
jgi:hypothetical protein